MVPYIKLARIHRPHGIWLLLLPCAWGIALASPAEPPLSLLLLFAIGAVFMRSAGCVYNDMIDKDFDANVRRTASRPLASGEISLKGASFFLLLLLGGAALILFSLPSPVIVAGFVALGLVLLYPWMKRLTYWPQLFLGLTYNMGVLMGWLSLEPTLLWTPLLFYAGAILWTLGYDTIYGLQDIEDDLVVGVKSAAIAVCSFPKLFLGIVYGGTLLLWGLGGQAATLKWPYWIALGMIAVQFSWQILSLQPNSPPNCLKRFQSNSSVGILLVIGIVFSRIIH
jgi:4-hydroxybenzoate polyprenyltransferase